VELKRKIYQKLLKWKSGSNGSSALLLTGACGVGKSYLCEAFGSREYKSMILVDFSNASKDIRDIFEYDRYDLDMFFSKLSAFYNTVLYARDSLIVFDEVQFFPLARQLVKHLVTGHIRHWINSEESFHTLWGIHISCTPEI